MAKKSEPAAMLQHYNELKARSTKYFINIGHPKGDLTLNEYFKTF